MSLSANQVSLTLGYHKALAGIRLEVVPGTLTAVIGPNGAGKTSLLRVMSGEIPPSTGTVTIDGERLDRLSAAELATRRCAMGQSALLAFNFLVEEVLAMGWVHGAGHAERSVAMREASRRCGIAHLLGRPFRSLSGGEQQRVHFARALLQVWPNHADAHSPARYMLLDEPTSNMDFAQEIFILDVARNALALEVGVLMVLHNLNLAARFADRVLLINQGTMVALGTPEQVLTNELLSDVYRTPVVVEQHQTLGRLVVHTH